MTKQLADVSASYQRWRAEGSAQKEVALRVFEEVISGGDMAAADALITQDFVDHFAMRRGAASGLGGFKAGLEMIRSAFPDWRSEVEDMVEEGDKVAVRWRVRGTHNGSFMGFEGTGKVIEMEEAGVMRFEGGKLAELWRVADEVALMQQLGLMPG
jgi:steroid delta-isomerase-like uncharacterized protein